MKMRYGIREIAAIISFVIFFLLFMSGLAPLARLYAQPPLKIAPSPTQLLTTAPTPIASPSPAQMQQPSQPTASDPNTQILAYEKFLQEDSKKCHSALVDEMKAQTAFWDVWYERLLKLLIAGVTAAVSMFALFFTVLSWLGFTSRGRAAAFFEAHFQEKVGTLVDKKIKDVEQSMADLQQKTDQFNAHLEASRQTLSNQSESIENETKTLSGRIEAQKADLTAFEKQTGNQLEITIDIASALSYAAVVLSPPPNAPNLKRQRAEAIKQLENVRIKVPHHRRVGIFLGRLYRALDDYKKAYEVLDQVLRDGDGKLCDTDRSALLFNKACYTNLQARETHDLEERVHLRERALNTLKDSVKASSLTFHEIQGDIDLNDLVQQPDLDELKKIAGLQ